MEVLYFSDREVAQKLFDRVDGATRPLVVVQVRQDRHARHPREREPFATFERRFGDVVDLVVVADEGTTEGMWRDPVGDLADRMYPNDKERAYTAASGYLLLHRGRPLGVVKKQAAHADALWLLQALLAEHFDEIPHPPLAQRPGKRDVRTPRNAHARPRSRESLDDEPTQTGAHRAPTPPPAPLSKDPWQVIGIPKGTPLGEAKKAYRTLISQYHPDKVAHLAPEFRELADVRTRQILEAWQRIEDDEA